MTSAVVFDFGAVLFRWRPAVVMAKCFPEEAATPAQAAALTERFFQQYQGDWGEFDRGAIEVPVLVEAIARRTGLPAAGVQAVVDAVPAELQPLPDSAALLQRLHARGHRLYFLSNMPKPYAAHLEQAHQPLLALFRDGLFSSRVGLLKPQREIFDLATDRFGLDPARTVFLDDSLPNVQAAQAVGWQAVHFTEAAQALVPLQAGGWL